MSKVEAIKQFFSTPEKPVTNVELIALRKGDATGFDWMAVECAKSLGVTLDTK